jgi:Rieske Fe-S protein
MNEKTKSCDETAGRICPNRREFLVTATAAGSLVLSLSAVEKTAAQKKDDTSGGKNTDSAAKETIIKIDEKSNLNKIGGSETFETVIGKLIVVRTADGFKAFSAVCPHKGGPITYDEQAKQFSCAWHNSRFDTKGQVLSGPTKAPLKNYATQNAIVLTSGS